MNANLNTPMRIVVAGASGFVGMNLLRHLSSTCQIIALTRSPLSSTSLPDHRLPGVYWLHCNLFSLKQTEAALSECDIAYFLVHSMMPSARLTQGQYDDLDLIIADNFSRAGFSAGIKRIIYLGGIQPPSGFLSHHLRSRLEVEKTLLCRNKNSIALRAGLILGAGGSSSLILLRLVRRLPILLCPPWTSKLSSPISSEDCVAALVDCLDVNSIKPGSYDLEGPEALSYKELMMRAAAEMNVRRFFIDIPAFSTELSRLWVSLITGFSRELVAPLVQSLQVEMLPGKCADVFQQKQQKMPLILALHQAEMPRIKLEIKSATSAIPQVSQADSVVSIQRMPLPNNWTSFDVAREYTQWLPKILKPFIRIEISANGEFIHFKCIGIRQPLLELQFVESRSDAHRALLLVRGGLLRSSNSSQLSRLEFRIIPEQNLVLAAVLDFTPALPWPIYLLTQAQAHRIIMMLFKKRMKKLSRIQ